MSALAKTQAMLAAALRRPTALAADAALESIAGGNDRLSPIEQIDIYREQFWLRHLDVLREDFVAIAKLVGEDAFDTLARRYLQTCPSASFSLRDLGMDLARFLEDPFAKEVAHVEWAFVECFDGPDTPPLDISSLSGIAEDDWPNAKLLVDPSLQILDLEWPAHDFRITARNEEGVPPIPEKRACSVVIYRGPELIHALEVDPVAAALLRELARGTPLGEACERAAPNGDIQTWFAEWTSLGWIRSIRVD